jgi:hypothetical protein
MRVIFPNYFINPKHEPSKDLTLSTKKSSLEEAIKYNVPGIPASFFFLQRI